MGGPGPQPQPKPDWRDNQCPQRQPSLSHVQDVRVFPDGRCVVCHAPLTAKPQEATPPPINVAERLEAMGIGPGNHADSTPVEPRATLTTEEWEKLPPKKRPPRRDGRLTKREENRLVFNCIYADREEVPPHAP